MEGDEFTLEKLKVNERLHNVELQIERFLSHLEVERGAMERMRADLNKTFERITELMDKHDKILMGDLVPGVLTRLDRLEQVETNRKWHFGIIWTGIVGMLIKMIVDHFSLK